MVYTAQHSVGVPFRTKNWKCFHFQCGNERKSLFLDSLLIELPKVKVWNANRFISDLNKHAIINNNN